MRRTRAVFDNQLALEGSDHGFQLVGAGIQGQYRGKLHWGWLNVETCGSSVPTMTIFSETPHVVKISEFNVALANLDANAADVRVGVVASEVETGTYTVTAVYVYLNLRSWELGWMSFRTVSSVSFVAELLSFMWPFVQTMPPVNIPELPFDDLSGLAVWVAGRESPVSAQTSPALPGPSYLPLFKDSQAVGSSTVYLDISQCCMRSVPDRPSSVVRGGVLSGSAGGGKFTALLRYVRDNPLVPCPPAPATLVPSRATLIVMPVSAAQWRIKQVLEVFPAGGVVRLLNGADFKNTSWHMVLTADVVVVTEKVFQYKWFVHHANSFLTNIAKNPERAAVLLKRFPPLEVVATASSRRPAKRTRAAAATPPVFTLDAESEAFFDEGAPTAMPIASDMWLRGMALTAAFQLNGAGTSWQHRLHRPVIQAINFQRIISVDLNEHAHRVSNPVHGLSGIVKWVTDSTGDDVWMDRVSRWNSILSEQDLNCELHEQLHVLSHCLGYVTARKALFRVATSHIKKTLLDELQPDDDGACVFAGTLYRSLPAHVTLSQPVDVVREVLVERERALLHQCLGFYNDGAGTDEEDDLIEYDDDSESSSSSSSSMHSSSSSQSSSSSYVVSEESAMSSSDTKMGQEEESEGEEKDSELGGEPVPSIEEVGQGIQYLLTQMFGGSAGTVSVTVSTAAWGGVDDPPSSAIPSASQPPPDHLLTQVALAARVNKVLECTIGKEVCHVCTVDMCNGMLSCGHAFCFHCIQQWTSEGQHSCPLCMRELDDNFPFFVPLLYRPYPLPVFCVDEECSEWAAQVCTPKLSSAAFWMLTQMRRSEQRGQQLVILINNDQDMRGLGTFLGKWVCTYGVWPCVQYTGAVPTRQRAETRFLTTKCHVIVSYRDVVAGCRFGGVQTVINLCKGLTSEEAEIIPLRLGPVTIQECVYCGDGLKLG